MPAWTSRNGDNYADKLDYKLWNPVLKEYQYISLDNAIGKVIVSTEVTYDDSVTIYLRDKDEQTTCQE